MVDPIMLLQPRVSHQVRKVSLQPLYEASTVVEVQDADRLAINLAASAATNSVLPRLGPAAGRSVFESKGGPQRSVLKRCHALRVIHAAILGPSSYSPRDRLRRVVVLQHVQR